MTIIVVGSTSTPSIEVVGGESKGDCGGGGEFTAVGGGDFAPGDGAGAGDGAVESATGDGAGEGGSVC